MVAGGYPDASGLFQPSVIDPVASGARFRSIGDVTEAMEDQLGSFESSEDHRAVFARVYLVMTREMQRRLAMTFFEDPEWMERVLVAFAGYYFDAVAAYDQAQPCPPAWRLALDIAASGNAVVLEDALLGINAHINSDLAIVMAQILGADEVWPDAHAMLRRRRDHDRVNDVLGELVDAVQRELTDHYARLTRIIDGLLGRGDECLSAQMMAHYRSTVWHQAELLLDASSDEDRADVRRVIEAEALTLGEQVRASLPFRLARPMAAITRRLRLL